MSAREEIEFRLGVMDCPDEPKCAGCEEAKALADRYRAEVLAADGQAYDGELEMLRGLARTLRMVVRPDDTDVDVAEVRRLLHHHASDNAAAREANGHSTRPADPVHDKLAARERRLEQLLDTIRTHGGKWTTGTLQDVRRATNGPVQRGTARRDLAELARRGFLAQHGAGDGRYYTLKTRKGGNA